MIVAVGKVIDRAHGSTQKKAQVRLALTWALLAQARQVVASMADGGKVMWLGLALSYFLSRRASELWAYANEHPSFRSAAVPTRCASISAGDITLDGQAYVAWLETIHPDRSGNSVETNDRK